MHLLRSHMNRIECSVLENPPQCTVSIRFTSDREHPSGLLVVREWTVEQTQAFADETVPKGTVARRLVAAGSDCHLTPVRFAVVAIILPGCGAEFLDCFDAFC